MRRPPQADTLMNAWISLLPGLSPAYLIGRTIAGPVAGMTPAMGKLAKGDQSVEIPARDVRSARWQWRLRYSGRA